jgi:hypothetical protein
MPQQSRAERNGSGLRGNLAVAWIRPEGVPGATCKQNEKNVDSGQQGTNEPWKEPGAFSNGRPRGTKNIVEKEQQKRKANEKKADG